jgi:hypothetical protein
LAAFDQEHERQKLAEFPTVAIRLALAVYFREGATGAFEHACRLSPVSSRAVATAARHTSSGM